MVAVDLATYVGLVDMAKEAANTILTTPARASCPRLACIFHIKDL
jgi:hypothetical protein